MGLLVLLLVGLMLAVLKDRKLKAANKYPKGSAAAPRKGEMQEIRTAFSPEYD